MSRAAAEGNVKVYFVPTIADTSEPTVAEAITAGSNITPFLTRDGLSTPSTQNTVDTASLNSVFDTTDVGSWGGSITLNLFRDDTTETNGWDLITYGLAGYLMVSRFGTPVATDTVEIYPVKAHQPVMQATAANEAQKATVMFAVTDTPVLDATLTA
jgi:hypothetical protein